MKKLLMAFIIFILSYANANAVILAWDAYTDTADGLVLYWAETSAPPETFSKVLLTTDTTYTVNDSFLKPNVSYDFWLKAYNAVDESESSNVVAYTREVVYTIPTDSLPVVIYDPPSMTITITINSGN